MTPGVIFLSRTFLSLLFPCIVIATVRFILDDHFGIFIPKRIVIATTVLGIPIITTIRLGWVQIKRRRRAAVLGARVPPMVTGKWLGNLDLLKEIANNIKHGYPGKRWRATFILILAIHNQSTGDGIWEWIEQLGTTYNLRIFWEDIVFTYEPENIKVCPKISCHKCALIRICFSRQSLLPIFQIM